MIRRRSKGALSADGPLAAGPPTSSSGMSPVTPIAETSWEGKLLRQEVFFFDSGEDQIFGSLFSASKPSGLPGLVICPPWGWEAFQLRDDCYSLARRVAERGGAGLVLDWVGHGDSSGNPADATIHRMVEIAGDAFTYARRAFPSVEWSFCGLRLGACAAAVASRHVTGDVLLLIQPSLDAPAHVGEIERLARRASLGRWNSEQPWAFGNPLPDLRDWLPELDALPALDSFPGRAAVVRFERPAVEVFSDKVEDLTVSGEWKTGLTRLSHRVLTPLVEAGVEWLTRTHQPGQR